MKMAAHRYPLGVMLAVAAMWSYGPTLSTLLQSWRRHPDYSHGFLVVPLALLMLWWRRDSRPHWIGRAGWEALPVLAMSVAMRWLGALWQAEWLDGWSLVVWVIGSVWLIGGRRFCLWALPAVGFLIFMVPLPYRLETALSLPLQSLATQLGSWTLQMLGQPAMAEGNTILLDDHRLDIERACSGLRVLTGVLALGVGYIIVSRRSWWENAVLLLAVLPIALIANTVRIVAAALALRYWSGSLWADLGHSAGGWLMIVVAALLFALFLQYTKSLVFRADEFDARGLVVQQNHGSVFNQDGFAGVDPIQ